MAAGCWLGTSNGLKICFAAKSSRNFLVQNVNASALWQACANLIANGVGYKSNLLTVIFIDGGRESEPNT
eukprot:1914501-Amphidinium_carterae.2